MNYPEAGIGRINFTVVILNTKVVVAQGGTEIKGVIPIDITPHQPQRVAGFYSPLDKHRHDNVDVIIHAHRADNAWT